MYIQIEYQMLTPQLHTQLGDWRLLSLNNSLCACVLKQS